PFFFTATAAASALPSFPTRRSSDLKVGDSQMAWLEHGEPGSLPVLPNAVISEQGLDRILGGGGKAHAIWLKLDHGEQVHVELEADRKSTRLNSSHRTISYAVFCLKK